MKKCTNCNKEYDDGKMFCPECGCPLTSIASSETGGTTISSNSNENLKTDGQRPALLPSDWVGTILAVVGLVIQWELSALVGAIFIGLGFYSGMHSTNSGNKIVTTILLVIGIILLLATMLV